MELWIRSQDKTRLVKVCSLEYGEYKEKHYINGYCVNEVDNYDLGIYKSKERALEVLDEIQNLFIFEIKNVSYEQADLLFKGRMLPVIYEMPEK